VTLDSNLPHSYIDGNTFKNDISKNFSQSNLPKQERFRFREIAEKELTHLPSPLNYNLMNVNSIVNKTTVSALDRVKQSRMK
jgi:hypothetical protein